jgi:archaellin
MWRYNKKAIMGIGTLIIFIATILVAAVAAGVLISTSGILQQRALITGQEARKKITNSIEVISILAQGNKSEETLNNFEILVRLDAGSDPIQLKGFDISWIGPVYDGAGSLEHFTLNNPNIDEDGFNDAVGAVTNSSWTYIRDLDDDNIMERVMIVNYMDNNSVGADNDYLLINYSDDEADYYYIPLGYDIGNATADPVSIEIEDLPLVGQDGLYYGFMHITGDAVTGNSLNGVNNTFNITANPYECSFTTLSPENAYCFQSMHGDDDLVLNGGEVHKILYKLTEPHKMSIGEEFRFIFASEKGRLSQAQARTPDVITTLKVPLWPVG